MATFSVATAFATTLACVCHGMTRCGIQLDRIVGGWNMLLSEGGVLLKHSGSGDDPNELLAGMGDSGCHHAAAE